MLIRHDPVEADLVRPDILLMVLVIQPMRVHRIEIAIGKVETTGGVLCQGLFLHLRVGLWGVKEDFNLLLHGDLLRAWVKERVASFQHHRSCSKCSRCQPTTAYHGGTVREMRGTPLRCGALSGLASRRFHCLGSRQAQARNRSYIFPGLLSHTLRYRMGQIAVGPWHL